MSVERKVEWDERLRFLDAVCSLYRLPFDPKLYEQDFPQPDSFATFHEAARTLGFKAGQSNHPWGSQNLLLPAITDVRLWRGPNQGGNIQSAADTIPLSAVAAQLADMQGAGAVRDLREAASLSPTLAADIASLNGTTRRQMLDKLDTLIQHWSDTANFKTSQERARDKYGISQFCLDSANDCYWRVESGI